MSPLTATLMFKSGAAILDIMQRLGHNNIATTGRYLNSLSSPANAFASTVLNEMGIEDIPEVLQG